MGQTLFNCPSIVYFDDVSKYFFQKSLDIIIIFKGFIDKIIKLKLSKAIKTRDGGIKIIVNDVLKNNTSKGPQI